MKNQHQENEKIRKFSQKKKQFNLGNLFDFFRMKKKERKWVRDRFRGRWQIVVIFN